MSDQLLLYDQAVSTWVVDNFTPLAEGRDTQVLFATPRKSFAEVTSGILVDNRRLTLPRVSIQRLNTRNDPNRYNSNRVRRLGYCDPPLQSKLLSGKYPTPISITYQIDLWSKFVFEMNQWERFIHDTFASQYTYLQIHPNDTWGDKIYAVFLDGDIDDNSDLEPDDRERQIRRTFSIRCECWFFDDVFIKRRTVKAVEVPIHDLDSGSQIDTAIMPPIESIEVGVSGAATVFSKTLDRSPVLAHTVVVSAVFGGTTKIAEDKGDGTWVGEEVSAGSIVYSTGVMTITFTTPPDAGTDVTITYFTDLS